MRYLVLGGAGRMGQTTVATLLSYGDTKNVLVGDVSASRLSALKDAMNDQRLTTQVLNVRNQAELVSAMQKADVTINAVWYEFNLVVMKAAMASHKPLIDLGGLYTVTRQQLDMHDEVKASGTLVIPGMGDDPGTSNVLCRLAYDRLGGADEVHIRYGSNSSGETFAFSARTVLEEAALDAVVVRDGEAKRIPALSDSEITEFRAPIGPMETFSIIHSELASLPVTLPNVKEITYKDSWSADMIQKMKTLREMGLLSDEQVKMGKEEHRARAASASIITQVFREDPPTYVGDSLKILARKHSPDVTREHRFEVVRLGTDKRGAGPTETLTGIPPAIVARMIANGTIREVGVRPPETCVPPLAFLRDLASFEIEIYESSMDTKVICH